MSHTEHVPRSRHRSAHALTCFLLIACNSSSSPDGGASNSDEKTCSDASPEFCPAAVCGNGVIEYGEYCDQGNDNGTGEAVCRADCTGVQRCGNGVIEGTEACDDGLHCDDSVGPRTSCESESHCSGMGDGKCAPRSQDYCDSICQSSARCGDGIVQTMAGETCDDGNNENNDDCLDNCRANICGDGMVNSNGPQHIEACDDGLSNSNGGACTTACVSVTCGDGVVDSATEECDSIPPTGLPVLSDSQSGDCSTVCRTNCVCPRCGDGVTDYALGEQCDDLNATAGDGCGVTCQLEVSSLCGNGRVEGANQELCDDGSQCANGADCTDDASACAALTANDCGPRSGDGCSATCQYELLGATCGDGEVTGALEICDPGLSICADGVTACASDADCGVFAQKRCLNAGDDTCNATCSGANRTDTFHPLTGSATMTSDNRYLWYADEAAGSVSRLDIDACITHHENTTNPCTDNSAGPPTCADPCTAELVLGSIPSPTAPSTHVIRPTAPATDGETLWFLASGGTTASCCGCGQAPTEAYMYQLDLQACATVLETGAADCSGIEQIVAGSSWGHVDGVGTAAQLSGLRATTYYDGLLYFLDAACGTLRAFDPVSTSVTTLIGDPGCPAASTGFVAGTGRSASLWSPRYMTADHSGFLYISDNFDNTISRYNTRTGFLERWVGSAAVSAGYLDAADGAQARFARPRDLTSDGTSIYVSDFDNYTIRQIDIRTTRVTTMVGIPSPGTAPGSKCDLNFGQGARIGTGAQFTKPLSINYHFPSGSLFFYTGGLNPGGPCTSACAATAVANQIWRVR